MPGSYQTRNESNRLLGARVASCPNLEPRAFVLAGLRGSSLRFPCEATKPEVPRQVCSSYWFLPDAVWPTAAKRQPRARSARRSSEAAAPHRGPTGANFNDH